MDCLNHIDILSIGIQEIKCIQILKSRKVFIQGNTINSSPPGDAYMRQWIRSVLVQIMACRLFSAKPISIPMLGYSQLNPRNKLHLNSNQNVKLLICENAYKNIVCEIAAILPWRRWVKNAACKMVAVLSRPQNVHFTWSDGCNFSTCSITFQASYLCT